MSQNSRIKFFKEIEKYQQQKIFATQRFDRLYVLIGIFFSYTNIFFTMLDIQIMSKSPNIYYSQL